MRSLVDHMFALQYKSRARWAAVFIAFVSAVNALAICAVAAPAIDHLWPCAMTRGTTVSVNIYGNDLVDPQDIIFYQPGIKLIEFEAPKPNLVVAHLQVEKDCSPGLHRLRLVTSRGITRIHSLAITPLPIVGESKPQTPGEPALISIPATVIGNIDNEDEDRFAVDLEKGQRVNFEVVCIRLSRDFDDPILKIYGPDGDEVAVSDDVMLTRQDPAIWFQAGKKGRYVVEIRDVMRRGSRRYHYALHIGDFPRPQYAWPLGGKPGEHLRVTWYEPGRDPWDQMVRLPSRSTNPRFAAPEFVAFAESQRGISPTGNILRIVDADNSIEIEPNDSAAAATPVTLPGTFCGRMDRPQDIDWFKFRAKKGQVIEIRTFARRSIRSPMDPWIQLRQNGTKHIASNDDSGGPDSVIEFTAPADDDYTIFIRDQLYRGGDDFLYRIEATIRQPSLRIIAPDRRFRVPTTVSLPRGNRMAVLFNAQKRYFDSGIKIQLDDLPLGVTADIPEIPKGRNQVPVVLNVAPDANRCGQLVSVAGAGTAGDKPVVGDFNQRAILVQGANAVDIWGHDADRLAMAVKDESPFSIELVQPNVPIVRNGSIDLKVIARRDEGFDGPITVRPIYNPPGVTCRNGVTIPAGQNEAKVYTTANGGAAMGPAPIVLLATASRAGQSHEVSSQIITLNVADSLFNTEFAKANVEKGSQTELVVSIDRKREYEGTAKAELVGLPAGTSSEPLELSADVKELKFVVKATEKARVGRFKTIRCRFTVNQGGEFITQTNGTGQLRVDEPLPKPESGDSKESVDKVASQ